MRGVGILLVLVAFVAGMVGCAGPVQYSLTISTTEGGEITTPGEGTFNYDEGAEVPLVAFPHAGYRFVNWTGDVGTVADINAASTTVTINDNYSITANFIAQYALTIDSTDGGHVTTPGEGTFTYDAGAVVNLVAQAEQGYHFVNWTGDVTIIANVTATTTSITMNSSCIISASFTIDLYFQVDANCVLHGPATLPPEQRNPSILLQVYTNVVMHSVRVDLPGDRSVIIPAYTGVFTPEVDWTTVFRFVGGEPGMPVAGGEYVFTGLDVTGEPIPEATRADIWVGVEPPNPPTNVRAELTEDGILVSWDESPEVPGSFEPAAEPGVGFYQIGIYRVETGEDVYGVNLVSVSWYLIPEDKADFTGYDHGLSLGEMEDGTYGLAVSSHGMAPEGSLGGGHEYTCSDPGQTVVFIVQDGEIAIG
jgi:hypothetical protein